MLTAISLSDVTVTRSRQAILADISIDLDRGQIIGLIGPSGAGKTTLIRCLVGRQRPSGGKITIFGHPAGSAVLRPKIGYMTQNPAVYNDLSVTENLRYFAIMAGIRRAATAVTRVLATVDLENQADQLVGTLSGGQRQRVSLAVAIIARPELLVLDEPTVGLDPVLREALWVLFGKLATGGTTIIVSSHVMDEASRCGDLILLRDGRVLSHASPAKLCATTGTKSVEAAFLKLVGAKS